MAHRELLLPGVRPTARGGAPPSRPRTKPKLPTPKKPDEEKDERLIAELHQEAHKRRAKERRTQELEDFWDAVLPPAKATPSAFDPDYWGPALSDPSGLGFKVDAATAFLRKKNALADRRTLPLEANLRAGENDPQNLELSQTIEPPTSGELDQDLYVMNTVNN